MRLITSLFIILSLLCSAAFAMDTNDQKRPTPPQTITFQGIEMHRAFEEEKGESFIIEYLPKGETLEKWTYLFAIRKEAFAGSPAIRVNEIAKHLKKQNPNFNSQVLTSKTGNLGLIDFMIWPKDGSFAEFNSWKYMMAAEEGWLISFQFARRGYHDTHSYKAFEKFMPRKQGAVKEMINFKMPAS